ncbi:hypothetical protein EK21DRAFT_95643 [Setomelanomma holmii]|uniref:Uncharacterized protein n=1 Tax=Setomelanomma holmii TaxID=210430 RepID=A0A9P4GVH0_9PLEO|nr:hypothetical protein EK21DRAFT_95643 [Setomelanomma holmii]
MSFSNSSTIGGASNEQVEPLVRVRQAHGPKRRYNKLIKRAKPNSPLTSTLFSPQLRYQQEFQLQLLNTIYDVSNTPSPLASIFSPLGHKVETVVTEGAPAHCEGVSILLSEIWHEAKLSLNRLRCIRSTRPRRFVMKASQLCQLSQSEVYMIVRHDGQFYIYNSVKPTSRKAPQPQGSETIVNVTVAEPIFE